MLIYTEPQYHGLRPGGHGYEHYTREVYCTCGKRIGKQTKYADWDDFSYDDREKAEYKFCPYCGNKITKEN